MVYFYFCRKCEGDAGTKNGLCLECDSKAGVPRFGKATLRLSRAAYEEDVAKKKADIAKKKAKADHERRMNNRVSIDEAIELAKGRTERRIARKREAEASIRKERRKLAEARRAEKLSSGGSRGISQREKSLRPPPPPSYPYGVSPVGAERLVSDWMCHLGAEDARVTNFTSDGGIDVESENYVAQVKLYANTSVGRPEIQQLVGAALVSGKRALFFTSSSFTAEAKEYAAHAEVALFRFVPEDGTLTGVDPLGQKKRETGLAD